jgi:hypothetical protein
VLPKIILKLPFLALLVLGLKGFLISQLTGPDAFVLGDSEEIEADFVFGITGDSALEDGDELLGEFRLSAGAVRDGGTLEAIEFVELVVDDGVSDEVVGFVVGGGGTGGLVDEGGGAGEGVVDGTDAF